MRNLRMKRTSGFTLIEVLIALSLLAITAFAVMTSFIQGVKIFSRFSGISSQQEKIFFIEGFTRDLKNSTYYSALPWSISSEQISFPSIPTQAEGAGLGGLPCRVIYKFDPQKKEVTRTELVPGADDPENKSRVVATNVQRLKFESSGDGSDLAPAKVMISLDHGRGPAIYSIKKTVLIPSSYREKS